MEELKVILVDDHDILMDGIESILNEAVHISVVGKASSAIIAEELIQKTNPSLVITDISMGEVSGLHLTKRIAEKYPLVRVIVLSMHDTAHHISSMLEAGASAYLLKSVKQDELFTAIEKVMAGEQYIQQSLAANYIQSLQQQRIAEKKSPLSPREIEIIRLISEELTTSEISRKLFLSEHTIETHRKNIGRKTGAKSVVGLLNYARENGIL